MRSHGKELVMEVPRRRAFIKHHARGREGARRERHPRGPGPGHAHAHHGFVFINDDEAGLHQDYEAFLERIAPHAPTDQYRHNRTGEDNADAHIKRQIMGQQVVYQNAGEHAAQFTARQAAETPAICYFGATSLNMVVHPVTPGFRYPL